MMDVRCSAGRNGLVMCTEIHKVSTEYDDHVWIKIAHTTAMYNEESNIEQAEKKAANLAYNEERCLLPSHACHA
jgi:hypothetical protein